MVNWRDPSGAKKKDVADFPADALTQPPLQASAAPAPSPAEPRPTPAPPAAKESVIAADLSIEGKIEGAGHVRIAGKFKGDVNIKGELTIEKGACLTGAVRAEKVTAAGELQGNIEAAKRVDLLASSVMDGDIRADDLIIASGARLRGRVECGNWDTPAAASKKDESSP